ncbi:endo-1,4-beta-xylanase [Mariniblastus fucicola]|nr:endo-1,4-beta-xylanase [Mariniblastus fucicola]
MDQTKQNRHLLAWAIAIVCMWANGGSAQAIRNGEFDEGLSWWLSRGGTTLAVSEDSHQTAGACLVTNRTDFWHGVSQPIDQASLEPGKDYYVEAWVKPVGDVSGTMRFLLFQVDDRGERGLKVGEGVAEPGQWVKMRGGFTFDPYGEIQHLILAIDGSEDDRHTFDFLVDSVTVTENEWRQEADDRIEQIRKRDVVLNFSRSNGKPVAGLSVGVEQVSHDFPFGSTLNWRFEQDEVYRDFFREHFDWATIEWHAQWRAVEFTQGQEDYSIADASIDFCEQNGIRVKGHALFWPAEQFRPPWLEALSDSQLMQAMDRRITDVVSRFQARLYAWDVNNEMLNHTFFQDRLGESIRSWMFQRAREVDPAAKLLVNEYGLENSEAKTIRYRELVESLGSNVDGVGFQSHFDGLASPMGIEIAMEQFQDSGLGIWFTEYDTVHPDPEKRAQSLEDFYRFVFSCPETEGIIMWGFWAGSHWRGADASLVDLDWTINAAGQRYFALMDEWTTESEGSTDGSGDFEFRGFLGSYLVTTTDDAGIVNYHLVPVSKGEGSLLANLATNAAHNSLSIYGTDENDLFELDLAQSELIYVNGSPVNFELPVEASGVRVVGLSGDDRLVIQASPELQNLLVTPSRMIVRGIGSVIRFHDLENVEVKAASLDSRVVLGDSPDDDTLNSFENITTLTNSQVALSVVGFGTVAAYSVRGQDTARVFDSAAVDQFTTDLESVNVKLGGRTRQVSGFAENLVESSIGYDTIEIRNSEVADSIDISSDAIVANLDQTDSRFHFNGFRRASLLAQEGSATAVHVVGTDTDETLRITSEESLYYGPGFRYSFEPYFAFEGLVDSAGNDRLVFRDSVANNVLSVSGDSTTISDGPLTHSFQFLDEVSAFSRAGGTDTATIDNPNASVRLVGDWHQPE